MTMWSWMSSPASFRNKTTGILISAPYPSLCTTGSLSWQFSIGKQSVSAHMQQLSNKLKTVAPWCCAAWACWTKGQALDLWAVNKKGSMSFMVVALISNPHHLGLNHAVSPKCCWLPSTVQLWQQLSWQQWQIYQQQFNNGSSVKISFTTVVRPLAPTTAAPSTKSPATVAPTTVLPMTAVPTSPTAMTLTKRSSNSSEKSKVL